MASHDRPTVAGAEMDQKSRTREWAHNHEDVKWPAAKTAWQCHIHREAAYHRGYWLIPRSVAWHSAGEASLQNGRRTLEDKNRRWDVWLRWQLQVLYQHKATQSPLLAWDMHQGHPYQLHCHIWRIGRPAAWRCGQAREARDRVETRWANCEDGRV